MAFEFYLRVFSTLLVWAAAKNAHIPEGITMLCYERYFMISIDQSFTGNNPRFEAVDGTGTYPITEEYAAKCGYSVRALYSNSIVQLRASYFSCHTDNKDDKEFRFGFNLIAQHKGKEVTYALNKTCAPSLSWSLREVTCEVNYIEVSVKSEITCPSETRKNDWDNLKLGHSSSSADWQVSFQTAGQHLPPMNLTEARKQNYVFDLTGGRLVFRTPYGRPYSFTTEMDGIPVEVVHATLFSRQSWLVLLVDLVAACSMYEGIYEDEGYMSWETPDVLYPGLQTTNFSFGLNGELLQPASAEKKGYIMEKHNSTVQISIPYDAEGGYRKSYVSGDLYEFITYDFYMEQISVDEDDIETRLRFHRTLRTPLLKQTILVENRTVLEERNFTIYLGDIPKDVELISFALNKHTFQVPFGNQSTFSVKRVVHPNNTHGYTLKVPFHNSVVMQKYFKAEIIFKLYLNYTLMIMPENQMYHQSASFVAIILDLSPPQFDASCSESGMSFKLDHKPSNVLWEISVGSDPLTSELAAKQGYIMSNNSRTLQLDVPLLSEGYEKKNLSLQGFVGTFEINMRHREKSAVQSSSVKTCPFFTNELIVCSTTGRMTVVADLSLAVVNGGIPAKTTLLDINCRPREADTTRAMFSFPMNYCGSIVKVENGIVTYENEILYSKRLSSDAAERILLQCAYPVSSLHRLFSAMTFEADTPGVGRIVHTSKSAIGPQITTEAPAIPPQPSLYSSARYIKVSGLKFSSKLTKRVAGSSVQTARKAF